MPRDDAPRSGAHRTDALSLVFGLLFLGFAGAWAADQFLGLDWIVDWDLPHLGWIIAGALVLVGLLGILASIRRDKDEPAMPSPPVDAPAPAVAMPSPPVDAPAPPVDVPAAPTDEPDTPARPVDVPRYEWTDPTAEPIDPVRRPDRPE